VMINVEVTEVPVAKAAQYSVPAYTGPMVNVALAVMDKRVALRAVVSITGALRSRVGEAVGRILGWVRYKIQGTG
jgi:hypothetical protein